MLVFSLIWRGFSLNKGESVSFRGSQEAMENLTGGSLRCKFWVLQEMLVTTEDVAKIIEDLVNGDI